MADMQDVEEVGETVVIDVDGMVQAARDAALEFVRNSSRSSPRRQLEVELDFGLDGSGLAFAVGWKSNGMDLGIDLGTATSLDMLDNLELYGGVLWLELVESEHGVDLIDMIEDNYIEDHVLQFFKAIKRVRAAEAREFFKSFENYGAAQREAARVISSAAASKAH